MGLFDRWRTAVPEERAGQLPNPLASVTHSGKKIDAETALELIPVYSAIQLISGAIASLPIKVYRDLPDGGRVAAPGHRAQRLLDRPTPTMAGDEWRQIMMVHLLTWGNFYAAKEFDQSGFVSALWPIHPQRVKVARAKGSGTLEYFVDDKPFDEKGLLHIRGMGDDGVVGFSPIQHARHALGMAASLEEFTSKFFNNGARPGVILQHPSRISPEAAERLRAQWSAAHGGAKNAFSTVVVEEGISVQTLTMPIGAGGADVAALSKLSLAQVALLYRIPPYMMGADSGGSLTYSTTELEGRHFVTWCLNPYLMRVEQALLRDPHCFSDNGLGSQFRPVFQVKELMRGDNKTAAETDVMLLNAGIITVDEARQNLGMNPMADSVVSDVPVVDSDAVSAVSQPVAQTDSPAS